MTLQEKVGDKTPTKWQSPLQQSICVNAKRLFVQHAVSAAHCHHAAFSNISNVNVVLYQHLCLTTNMRNNKILQIKHKKYFVFDYMTHTSFHSSLRFVRLRVVRSCVVLQRLRPYIFLHTAPQSTDGRNESYYTI